MGNPMNLRTSSLQPEDLVEPLDTDLDSLDHALMDLVTSDWQTLDGGGPHDAAVVPQRISPLARGTAA